MTALCQGSCGQRQARQISTKKYELDSPIFASQFSSRQEPCVGSWSLFLPLIILLTGYTVWPIYDLYRIASAVETRNPAALQELVDFPSLRASLTKQIVDAHRKLRDKSVVLSDRSERPAVGVGLTKILHSERLLDLLAAPLTANSFGSAWQIWFNSDYSGRTFYVTFLLTDLPINVSAFGFDWFIGTGNCWHSSCQKARRRTWPKSSRD